MHMQVPTATAGKAESLTPNELKLHTALKAMASSEGVSPADIIAHKTALVDAFMDLLGGDFSRKSLSEARRIFFNIADEFDIQVDAGDMYTQALEGALVESHRQQDVKPNGDDVVEALADYTSERLQTAGIRDPGAAGLSMM